MFQVSKQSAEKNRQLKQRVEGEEELGKLLREIGKN